ncbi:glucosamine 6-phosphate N-acetyltransferase isoform 2-T2 [Pholidichthys leucotaenia]
MLLDETPLFEPSLLQELDWSENTVSFSPPISPSCLGEGLVLRPLCQKDFSRGFFKVLSQLTQTGDVTPEQFSKKFEHMKKTGDYYIIVVEDTNLGQIVATATLITEHKFIHSCAKGSKHCNTNGRSVWTKGETMLKNKPHLVKFDHYELFSPLYSGEKRPSRGSGGQ